MGCPACVQHYNSYRRPKMACMSNLLDDRPLTIRHNRTQNYTVRGNVPEVQGHVPTLTHSNLPPLGLTSESVNDNYRVYIQRNFIIYNHEKKTELSVLEITILRKTIEGYGFCFDFIVKGIIISTQIINRYVAEPSLCKNFHKIFALPGSASRRLAETLEHP